MKKSFKITLFVVILAIIAIFAVSCGDDGVYTSIETPNLEYKDGAYTINVSSDIKKLDLSSLFSVSENATFIISQSEDFSKTVDYEVDLIDGINKYFVKVTDKNKNEMVYQFVIIRSKLCDVTFNTNGGSAIPTIQCEEGRILEAPVSIMPGYTLKWDYDFNKPITESITINAEWTANNYKITIDGTDNVVEVTFGTKPSLAAPEKKGYKFTGWQYNNAAFDATQDYNIDSDITVKPIYEIQKYSINYITIGGENSNPLTYTVEDELVFEALTWATGENDTVIYEFAGWFKDANFEVPFEKIEKGTTENIIVYAKWIVTDIPEEKIETTITFNAPDFDCNGTTQVVTVGDEYTLPTLEKNGYIFAGWKAEDGSIIVQASGVWAYEAEAVTLVPSWTKRAYSITYILSGGTNNKQNVEVYYITDKVSLYNPEKQYSSFGGWYIDENLENAIEEIPEGTYGDMILYAKWEEIKYDITYDANGGEISQTKQTVTLGGNYILITPVKLGYTFDGWYDGDNLVEINGVWTQESSAALMARWSLETYTLEHDLDGGTITGWIDSYTIKDKITLPIPTKEGKIFLGWSINNGPIVKHTVLVAGSVGNRVYVAHWCDSEAENGVVYSISNGFATVVGYNGTVGANITIPSEYNGYKVIAIGNNAFSGYGKKLENLQGASSSFTTFVIPNTITRIGANAFTECDDLKVQLADADDDKINEWVEKIVIESGNDHVLDVIMGKRPAIGWRVYYKPE